MNKEKSPEELRKEKEQLKVQDQKTENVFEDKVELPNEQNRLERNQAANNKTPCTYAGSFVILILFPLCQPRALYLLPILVTVRVTFPNVIFIVNTIRIFLTFTPPTTFFCQK